MPLTTLFFDLDDTVYPSSCGLWNAIRDRMGLYMYERLGLPWEEIPELRRTYFMTYGTTLRGLQKHFRVDPEDYLAYVHDLPLDQFLKPVPELRQLLLSLPQQRWIFTNADADHARRVLTFLDIADCFRGVIDVRAIEFACKPEPEAYHRAMSLAEASDPMDCAMLDDSSRNLAPARKLGFTTVLVGGNGLPEPAATLTIPSLLDLPGALPELWNHGF